MIRILLILSALLLAIPAHAVGVAMSAVENTNWQTQFSGAVSWTTYGVIDDSGVTDNTAALNSIPGNTPIIADCPHGGTVNYTGTWNWPSGLTVWEQPGCKMVGTSSSASPIGAPITSLTSKSPQTNIKYYGLDFTCGTPTQGLRAISGWIDHFKLIHFSIKQCGAFIIRGSDQEIAFGYVDTTPEIISGNPGLRHVGNMPQVAASAGMWANDDFHNLNFRSGDVAYQVCQVFNQNPSSFFAGVSTSNVIYRDSYANTYSGVTLVNFDNVTGPYFSCNDVTFENINGTGTLFAWVIPGKDNSVTSNIRFLHSTFTMGSQTGHDATSVGNFPAINVQPTGTNMSNITFDGVNFLGSRKSGLALYGCFPGIVVKNSTIAQVTNDGTYPALYMSGTCGTTVSNLTISPTSSNAIELGSNSQPSAYLPSTLSSNDVFTNLTITNVPDGNSGFALFNVNGATITGGSVSKATGSTMATGITLTANPTGTNNTTITGVTLTGMPTPVVCAPGQGNAVTGNPGASNCPP